MLTLQKFHSQQGVLFIGVKQINLASRKTCVTKRGENGTFGNVTIIILSPWRKNIDVCFLTYDDKTHQKKHEENKAPAGSSISGSSTDESKNKLC